MTIGEVISNNYDYLSMYCVKNKIKRIEIQCGIKDIEDIDLLHTMIIRWLNKYKSSDFTNSVEIVNKLKVEFDFERNRFMKFEKPTQINYTSLIDNILSNEI